MYYRTINMSEFGHNLSRIEMKKIIAGSSDPGEGGCSEEIDCGHKVISCESTGSDCSSTSTCIQCGNTSQCC